jgi:O-antigen/teichoic acid export membrane protein
MKIVLEVCLVLTSKFKSFKSSSLPAIIDQAWLSIISLFISVFFIRYGSKAEYGAYTMMFAIILFVQGIQNALIISPMLSIFPKNEDLRVIEFFNSVKKLNLLLSFLIGSFTFFTIYTLGKLNYSKVISGFEFAFVMGLATIGVMTREINRYIEYAKSASFEALKKDLIYGFFISLGIFIMYIADKSSAKNMLLTLGISGLISTSVVSNAFQVSHLKELILNFWGCAKWALPSVIVTWINLNSYPLIIENVLGVESVAEISISRVIIMPIGLITVAWSNAYRAKIGYLLHKGNFRSLRKIIRLSTICYLILTFIFGVLIYFYYNTLELFLSQKYSGLKCCVLGWLLYSLINFIRTVYGAVLLCDSNGYKYVHHITWLAFLVSIPAYITLTKYGVLYVIFVLIAVELIHLVSFYARCRKRLG